LLCFKYYLKIKIGKLDTLNIDSCEINSENSFKIKLSMITPSNKMNSRYKINLDSNLNKKAEIEIIFQINEECKLYMDYLNLVCNLVKSRFFSNNENKILISNY